MEDQTYFLTKEEMKIAVEIYLNDKRFKKPVSVLHVEEEKSRSVFTATIRPKEENNNGLQGRPRNKHQQA